MSTSRLIKLARIFSIKYAETSIDANVHINMVDAVEILTQIVNRQPISKDGKSYPWYGQKQAGEVLNYIKGRLSGQPTRLFVNLNHIDSILANMVYNNVPDTTVSTNMKVILDALKDQRLEETGTFKVSSIQEGIDRYKKALANNGSGEAASIWSLGGSQRLSDWESVDRQERDTKQQQVEAYRNQQALQNAKLK